MLWWRMHEGMCMVVCASEVYAPAWYRRRGGFIVIIVIVVILVKIVMRIVQCVLL